MFLPRHPAVARAGRPAERSEPEPVLIPPRDRRTVAARPRWTAGRGFDARRLREEWRPAEAVGPGGAAVAVCRRLLRGLGLLVAFGGVLELLEADDAHARAEAAVAAVLLDVAATGAAAAAVVAAAAAAAAPPPPPP